MEQAEEDHVASCWSATHAASGPVAVKVECAFGRGFSGLVIIGNAGQVCEDGKERAKAALERLGWVAPARKILISFSPGDLKIDRSHIDLSISVLLAHVTRESSWVIRTQEWLFAAEIGLNGELRPVSGVVGWASAAKLEGLKGIVVAEENMRELGCLMRVSAALTPGSKEALQCVGFKTLDDVFSWLESGNLNSRGVEDYIPRDQPLNRPDFDDMDLSDDLGLVAAVSAAGMHSVLLRGSPGTGKSMFARRLPSILPRMSMSEQFDALRTYTVSHRQIDHAILAGIPPFRSPHHYTSLAALLGTHQTPGELALASGGVLFLDELPEFRRDVLEGLREPLETGEVAVSRAAGSTKWVAKALFVSAANNCPCGWSTSRRRTCECPTSRIQAYRNRLSGPLQERIDIHINMVEPSDQRSSLFSPPPKQEGLTKKLKEIVARARHRAGARNGELGVYLNRDIPAQKILTTFGLPATEAMKLTEKVVPSYTSARSLVRCLKVARTIADVGDRDEVCLEDIETAWNWQSLPAARERGEVMPV